MANKTKHKDDHKDNKYASGTNLPSPGPLKRDPDELDKILDNAIKDSMAVSDPIATVMPEVRKKTGATKR